MVNLDKALAKIEDIKKLPVDKFLTQAGLLVESEAKSLVPVHHGDLRNSISSRVEDNKAVIGTNLEYGIYVHQGTGIHAVNGDGRKDKWAWYDPTGDYTEDGEPGFISTTGMEPHPFLTDALHNVEPRLPDLAKRIIKEAGK